MQIIKSINILLYILSFWPFSWRLQGPNQGLSPKQRPRTNMIMMKFFAWVFLLAVLLLLVQANAEPRAEPLRRDEQIGRTNLWIHLQHVSRQVATSLMSPLSLSLSPVHTRSLFDVECTFSYFCGVFRHENEMHIIVIIPHLVFMFWLLDFVVFNFSFDSVFYTVFMCLSTCLFLLLYLWRARAPERNFIHSFIHIHSFIRSLNRSCYSPVHASNTHTQHLSLIHISEPTRPY